MIYLDNSATTKMDPEVLEAMLPYLQDEFGNPSSIHQLGRRARVAVENAREEIAHLIGAHPSEVIFTSGGTEANNAVIKSCCFESDLVDRVVCSSIEHPSVLRPVETAGRLGRDIATIPVDSQGFVRLDAIEQWNDRRTLISVMHANNEIGTIQPVEKIRTLCPDALLHTDAVQSLGKIPFRVDHLGVDFATFSAHKLHGPKGIGALYVRRGIPFKAHQEGGSQERNRRAGTEAVALIVGFQVAVRKAIAELEHRQHRMAQLRNLLRALLAEKVPGVVFHTPVENVLPNILHIGFEDGDRLDGDALLLALDMQGIAVSSGSACSAGTVQVSHVMKALGKSGPAAKAVIRFSLSKDTTEEEIRTAVETLAAIVEEMRMAQHV